MKKITVLFVLLTSLMACSDSEDFAKKEGIDASQLELLHANSSKKWRITHFYTNYKAEILDEEMTDCVKDDVYTFFTDEKEAQIDLGANSCYANYTDVTNELAGAIYSYYPEDRVLYLDFGRGAYAALNKITTSWAIITSCKFLSEDRMVFTNGIDGNGKGIVFERID
ncbi:conserved exported protein of unknown function [Tenacibaculum sp. 190130A14a]|uniref:Lipoprotein n=1 Tax=Tenacibaculum polynesiense TaxID=3137857 RepID=A0ABP1F8C4_9FLAO